MIKIGKGVCASTGFLIDVATMVVTPRRRRTAVFVFHSVVTHRSDSLDYHRPEVVKTFLRWLLDHAQITRTLEICDCSSITARPRAALTFDDGFLDNYLAVFPLLMEHRIPATFFIPTGLVGQANFMTRNQLREMSNSGMTIASHTVNHPWLSRCDNKTVVRELAESKAYIEDLTGCTCREIAYPYGDYDARIKQCAAESGYTHAFAANRANPFSETLALPRVAIPNELNHRSYAVALYDAHRWRRMIRKSRRVDEFVHHTLDYNPERLNWADTAR